MFIESTFACVIHVGDSQCCRGTATGSTFVDATSLAAQPSLRSLLAYKSNLAMSELNRRTMLEQSAAWMLAAGVGSAALSTSEASAQEPKPGPYADAKLVPGDLPPVAKDSFTIAVLPDTQNYSEKFPANFHAQTEWLVKHKADRNIVAVLHLGDVTNRNTVAEWEVAKSAMEKLDGHLPYFMALGNHDYSEGGGCKDRTTRYNDYFKLEKISQTPNFGGVYDKEPERLENIYHTLDAGGRKFLVIALEFGPRKDVVRWAAEVAGKHADREAILITHAYMYYDETRYDWKKFGAKQTWNPHSYPVAKATADDVSDGEELWSGLVAKSENFICTLNGHVLGDGLGRTITATPAGREVPQMLVNFQMKPNGGDGWLRLLEFQSDGKTVEVRDYSPTRGEQNESPQNRFTLTLVAPKVS